MVGRVGRRVGRARGGALAMSFFSPQGICIGRARVVVVDEGCSDGRLLLMSEGTSSA